MSDSASRSFGTGLHARLWRSGVAVDALLAATLALLIAHAVYYLVVGFDRPIYEQHGFRQTQTALSAYWILQGGPWLAYETPVLGAPWAVPFEFPTYQLIAAGLAWLGVPLDQAGRLVSFGFFIATLAPLRVLLREAGYDRTAFLIVAVLFVACPLYVFWGRTFMIESCALFLGVCWLAGFAAFMRRGGALVFALAMLAGCLVALTKSTTFAGFGGIVAAIVAAAMLRALRAGRLWTHWRSLLLLASLCAVPLAIGIAWVAYADVVKLDNPFAALLTAPQLTGWTYGTLAQRLSSAFWIDVVVKRMGPDIFGYGLVLMPLLVLAGLALTRCDWRILVAAGAFVLPLLLFTNLYFHHNYYANANALFLLVAVALSLTAIVARGWRVAALVLLACIVVGQWRYFRVTYDFFIRLDTRPGAVLQIGAAAKRAVPADRALLVIGDEWSSGVPYFSQRRALALPSFAPAPLIEAVLKQPKPYFGSAGLGGIVVCNDLSEYLPDVRPMIVTFLAGRTASAQAGACRLYPVTDDR